MYINFIASLILIRYIFVPLEFFINLPFRIIIPLLSETRNGMGWAHFVNQVIQSLAYAVVFGLVSFLYSAAPNARSPWIYAVSGFIVVFATLSANIAGKQAQMSQIQQLPLPDFLQTDSEKIIKGTTKAAFIGFAAYFIFFFWPESILSIPGSGGFFSWIVATSNELVSYLFVKAFLLISGITYLLAGGIPWFMGLSALLASRFRDRETQGQSSGENQGVTAQSPQSDTSLNSDPDDGTEELDENVADEEISFPPRRRLPLLSSDFDMIEVAKSILDDLIVKELDVQRKKSLNRMYYSLKALPWVTRGVWIEVSLGDCCFAIRGTSLEVYSRRYHFEAHAGGKRYEEGLDADWITEVLDAAARGNFSVVDESRNREKW